jgi:hypothetical protein
MGVTGTAHDTTGSEDFRRFAGAAAFAAGVGSFAYAISFLVFLHHATRGTKITLSLLLLLGGLATTAVLLAVYERVRDVDATFALWALVLGEVGAVTSALHGGYDLAVEIRHLQAPNLEPVDPRGLGTFGLLALSLLAFSVLGRRAVGYPRGLAWLGLASAVGLALLYSGRMSLFNPHRSVLLALLVLVGFALNPLWYLWTGWWLSRRA